MTLFLLQLLNQEIDDPRVTFTETRLPLSKYIPPTFDDARRIYVAKIKDGTALPTAFQPWTDEYIDAYIKRQEHYMWGDISSCARILLQSGTPSFYREIINIDRQNHVVYYHEVTRNYTVELHTAEEMLDFMREWRLFPHWNSGLTDYDD